MLKTISIQLVFIFALSASQIFGQEKIDISKTIFKNSTIVLDHKTKTPSSIRFLESDAVSIESFLKEYKEVFNLSEENEIRSYKISTDQMGITVHRHKQFYKGLELGEVQFILQEKNGLVLHTNGNLVHGLELDVTPSISEREALDYALASINADAYMWENMKNEVQLRKEQNDPTATMFPKGILMLSAKNFNLEKENFHLVYRFDIYAEKPMDRYYIDVDAKTGEIVNRISRIQSGDVPGKGTSVYNGTVSLTVADTTISAHYPSNWHVDSWSAYQGGLSWWCADPSLGNSGGYDNAWYEGLDTDPVLLSGTNPKLEFVHRYSVENPGGEPADYNAWDGMNVRISSDGGSTWQVLQNPVPAYTNTSLYSFGDQHGEGPGIPGWAGSLTNWTNVTFDLSTFTGQTVKIRFAFASDPAFSTGDNPNLFGWQIDNIIITSSSDTLYSNDGVATGVTESSLVKEASYIEGNYRLRQYSRGGGIATYDAKHGISYALSTDFVDADSSFDSENSKAGVSVHWALENTYDYFLNTLNRNSFDDNGSKFIAYAHYDDNWFNAQWDGSRLRFGDGDANSTPLVSIDIVSHELTHGVTQYTANLVYQNEYGALNESFSDVFGSAVEFSTLGLGANWFIGEGAARIRSMSNPKQYGQPNTYHGNMWYYGTDDGGGVHTNSGVQNYWYYLLSEGGSGVNDKGYSYSVTGIGLDAASKISYRNLTNYLFPTSEYDDARLGSIYSARDLFGDNSPQFQSVIEAWNAVGVIKPSLVPTINIESDTLNFAAEVLSSTDTINILISNYGLEILNISSVQLIGSNFQLISPPSFPVNLNYDESFILKIVFYPIQKGQEVGTITIASNDPENPNKILILRGEGFIVNAAQNGKIYALTYQINSKLLTLDQNSGNGVELGATEITKNYGVAIKPSTGQIFVTAVAAGISPLYRIDSETGKAYHVVDIPIANLRAIAFDTNDDLYGASYMGNLYLINLETGNLTLIGSTGISTFSGLAINPIDNQLWGTPLGEGIYKINKSNGAATLVGNSGFTQTPSIAFDSEGKLFGISGFAPSKISDLIRIDTSNGTGTIIGSTGYSLVSGIAMIGNITVGIEENKDNKLPSDYSLSQNYPNPFNPSTKIEYQIPELSFVTLKVYDLLGNEIATLVNEEKTAGSYSLQFSMNNLTTGQSGAQLSTGIYFYRLKAGNFVETKKMTLIK